MERLPSRMCTGAELIQISNDISSLNLPQSASLSILPHLRRQTILWLQCQPPHTMDRNQLHEVCLVNVKTCTTLNIDQDLEAPTATERNTCTGSYPVDIVEVQSSLSRSSEVVPVTSGGMFRRHGLNDENDPFLDAFVTPPDSPFTLPSEDVDPWSPNTLKSLAPFSVAISPSDPSQTLRVPSSSEMLSDSLGVLPTQHSGPINTDDVCSDLPNDLTDHVTRSDSHPFTSGGFGDIYRGDLDAAGRLINVSHRPFLLGKLSKD